MSGRNRNGASPPPMDFIKATGSSIMDSFGFSGIVNVANEPMQPNASTFTSFGNCSRVSEAAPSLKSAASVGSSSLGYPSYQQPLAPYDFRAPMILGKTLNGEVKAYARADFRRHKSKPVAPLSRNEQRSRFAFNGDEREDKEQQPKDVAEERGLGQQWQQKETGGEKTVEERRPRELDQPTEEFLPLGGDDGNSPSNVGFGGVVTEDSVSTGRSKESVLLQHWSTNNTDHTTPVREELKTPTKQEFKASVKKEPEPSPGFGVPTRNRIMMSASKRNDNARGQTFTPRNRLSSDGWGDHDAPKKSDIYNGGAGDCPFGDNHEQAPVAGGFGAPPAFLAAAGFSPIATTDSRPTASVRNKPAVDDQQQNGKIYRFGPCLNGLTRRSPSVEVREAPVVVPTATLIDFDGPDTVEPIATTSEPAASPNMDALAGLDLPISQAQNEPRNATSLNILGRLYTCSIRDELKKYPKFWEVIEAAATQ